MMEIKVVSSNNNQLLKRKEVEFRIEQGIQTKTPARLEVKRVLAAELKVGEERVFVQKMRTLTGTNTTIGSANIYENADQAKLVEPQHILKRNSPPEKQKEEAT
ncbi:MAG TPA: 30S ribosomal protein S24e [Candidatus Bathyarchaeia archaeon]